MADIRPPWYTFYRADECPPLLSAGLMSGTATTKKSTALQPTTRLPGLVTNSGNDMKPILLLVLLSMTLSCQKDVNPDTRLYGKWVLTGGSVLQKRQFSITQPLYFHFDRDGSVESNWGNCYSFRLGKAGELIANNTCADCIVPDCGREIWHYTFPAPYELTINFGLQGIGYFKR